jgi:hypothetical protein
MDWIDRSQDRYGGSALVNEVMNFGHYKMRGISGLAEELSASQEGLCSVELV